MLRNKIYQNFIKEIFKLFLIILTGLTLLAFSVRAVAFLDLIVENGYPISVYFHYSLLNLFGIAPKFIPLTFLLTIMIFIIRHIDDSEFVILWTSGVKKILLVNLILFISLIVLVFYLLFSLYITPMALQKSRLLLSQNNFNSLLPVLKANQFGDSFKGFTFIVEKKNNNEIEKVFLEDKGSSLTNLSVDLSKSVKTTITANKGIIDKKKLILVNGNIISVKDDKKNDLIKFDKLIVDLSRLQTSTVKKPKIQETSTLKLLSCILKDTFENKFCDNQVKKEIISNLSRRAILPLYLPALAMIISLLLINSKKIYLNKYGVFFYGFCLLIFTELLVRYTGLVSFIGIIYFIMPFLILISIYIYLVFKFSKSFEV